ncbi:MAG: tripartite tricarboxylate transporter permease, partial [Chromatiales bacterium]|nr:tripartite tricarboxylate transporter permease [Chromatiales bacterium]
DSVIKGLGMCCVGLLLGSVGAAPATAEFRLTFDSIYLSDGIPIVIVGLAMFALPEIVDLLQRRGSISETGTLGKGWLQGFKDAINHKWIVLRCSVIGCIVGALPGLGGSVVDWIAYGHVVQTTRDRENFGKGDIRGVLGPESANNAKEGGALIPTLLFGIPGSGSMAILLGGFVLVGVEPGIAMITEHLDLTFVMIWSLAIANVLGAILCLMLANQVAKLTTIRYELLAPFMLMLIFFAAFQATRDWHDLIALFVLGVFGVYMKRFGWSRPALLIGYFLAPRLEPKLYQAAQVYGWSFFERPIVIGLVILTILSVWAAWKFSPNAGKAYDEDGPSQAKQKRPQLIFTGFLLAIAIYAIVESTAYSFFGMIFPLMVASMAAVFLLPTVVLMWRQRAASPIFYDSQSQSQAGHGIYYFLGWILGMLGLVGLVGMPFGCAIFIFAFTSWHIEGGKLRNATLAVSGVAFLGVMSHFLTLRYPSGLLQSYIDMPWWLGG